MTPHITNREVATTFRRLADLLELRGETSFKVAAYRRASDTIGQLPESVAAVRARGDLEALPGVGKAIAQKVGDLLDTGTFRLLDEVQAQYPPGVADLLSVPEVGVKRARLLYEQLGVDGVDALRDAIEEHQLDGVAGLGPRAAARIAEGLAAMRPPEDRLPLGAARARSLDLAGRLSELPMVERAEVAGAVRRYVELVETLDLVAVSAEPQRVLDAFVALPGVARVRERLEGRLTVALEDGSPLDLRVVRPKEWGAALFFATGSDAHVARVKHLARETGGELTSEGLRRDGGTLTFATEEELYAAIDMQYVPPPMREALGEVELAREGALPQEMRAELLRGDLHTHSQWSDGARTIREMALAARARGYEYLCVTDHSRSLGVANGLGPERLAEQRREIDALNGELRPFRVLQGVELEVKGDGSLDLPDETLAALDLVIASVHSGLRKGRESVTSRATGAIRHPLVDILAHPTGRLVGGRAGGDFDMDALYAEAARAGTVLEINADPARLDLRDAHARAALQAGCTLSIGSDAHSLEGLASVAYGCAVATRAWAQPGDVLNSLPLGPLIERLKRNRAR